MRKLNSKGQSTVEFALTMILVLGFAFFYFQLSMVFAFGNLVHYATFMASRAYLSAGPTQFDQKKRAEAVMVSLVKGGTGRRGLDRWEALGKGSGAGFPKGVLIGKGDQYIDMDRGFSWQEGVRYRFRSRIFIVPFAGSEDVNSLTLSSETWLGREPNSDECRDFLDDYVDGVVILDNGC